MSLRVLIAPSCFKESLSADEAARAIEAGVVRALPDATVFRVPVVDGGEGFAEALVAEAGGASREVEVRGPMGQPVRAVFGLLREGEAVVEAASAIGLRLVPREERDPLRVRSDGVGMLIRAALDAGARSITIGCGDTANNDGGMGLSRELGVRFLDSSGAELEPTVAALRELARVDLSGVDPRIAGARLEVACNPMSLLCGPFGTSRVFSPYKGATRQAVDVLDAAMCRLAEVVEDQLGVAVAKLPGAGSGGGMATALHAFFGAALRPRYDIVMAHLPFEASLVRADLVFTGEGAIDATTLLGKVPFEVARRASAVGVPVVALVGQVGAGAEQGYGHGLDAIVPIARRARSVEEALVFARSDLERTAEETTRLIVAMRRRSSGGGAQPARSCSSSS